MSDQDYNSKRNFALTSEPKMVKRKGTSNELCFVIQKHEASHLHYDFRLEINGVLKSWSIPKGPSLNPDDKRLAIQTEDHPYEYKDFEGIISQREYGGGTVIIWDQGIYEDISESHDPIVNHKKGHLVFKLNGNKLKGSFILHRIKSENNNLWLLIKKEDGYENYKYDIENDDKSVVSNKTLKQIREEILKMRSD